MLHILLLSPCLCDIITLQVFARQEHILSKNIRSVPIMKRFIGLLLALCLIVGLLPVVAAADEVEFDGAAKIRLLARQ